MTRTRRLISFVLMLGMIVIGCSSGSNDEIDAGGGQEQVAAGDLDSDGIPDDEDDDVDGDGFSNDAEGTGDTDGDGTPDYRDRDSDNDGRPDIDEASEDTDGDGLSGRVDRDSDGDGVADGIDPSDDEDNSGEAINDPDGDGYDAAEDNCPEIANDQTNRFGDGPNGTGSDAEGDACDDTDGDGTYDVADECALDPERTLEPCETQTTDETASCLGIEGSADPDIMPVAFSATGLAGDPGPTSAGLGYIGAIPGVQGVFGGCVPVNPGDGGPSLICPDAITDRLPEAQIMGEFDGGLYFAFPLDGDIPSEISLDVGGCGDRPGQITVLQTDPDLEDIGEFAQVHFDPADEFTLPSDPAQIEPDQIGDLTPQQQEELVDDALDELTADQITEIDSGILTEVPTEEVAALDPEVIVAMPPQVLEAFEPAALADVLQNDLSEVPDSYVAGLTIGDLQTLEPLALATLDERQIELLGPQQQRFVEEQLEGFGTP